MTTPDPTPLDRALYDERAQWNDLARARDELADTLAAAQAVIATDRTTIAGKDATIAEQAARIVALEAQIPKPAGPIYGANLGGWSVHGQETQAQAKARIKAAFGKLPAIRTWTPYDGSVSAQYRDDTTTRYVNELAITLTDAQLAAAFKNANPGDVMAIAHEPGGKNKNGDPTVYRAFARRVGQAHVDSKRSDVTVCHMLMGGAYNPKRWSGAESGHKWSEWVETPLPPGIDAIGGDLYPWAADRGKPEVVIQPCIDRATELGVPFYVGEFGCGNFAWTDAERAAWTSKAFDMMDAAKLKDGSPMFPVVCVYESDNGGWCVLPKPDGIGGYSMTAAVVKDRMNR